MEQTRHSKIDTRIYGNLVNNKDGYQGKYYLKKWCRDNQIAISKKDKLDLHLISQIRINFKWISNLNAKKKKGIKVLRNYN